MGRRRTLTPLERLLAQQRQQQLEELERKLSEIDSELDQAVADKALLWQIGVGRFRVRRHITSEGIAIAYAILCIGSLVAGVILTLFAWARELGVALVVGSIFAIAAFMAQFWAVAAAQQQEILDDTYDRSARERLRNLTDERDHILESLAKLNGRGTVVKSEFVPSRGIIDAFEAIEWQVTQELSRRGVAAGERSMLRSRIRQAVEAGVLSDEIESEIDDLRTLRNLAVKGTGSITAAQTAEYLSSVMTVLKHIQEHSEPKPGVDATGS